MTHSAILPGASSDRRVVVGLLVLLFAITYLDRVCISVAGPRMQEDLGISPVGWGWVTGMFTFAYCLFEIPTGMMAAVILTFYLLESEPRGLVDDQRSTS